MKTQVQCRKTLLLQWRRDKKPCPQYMVVFFFWKKRSSPAVYYIFSFANAHTHTPYIFWFHFNGIHNFHWITVNAHRNCSMFSALPRIFILHWDIFWLKKKPWIFCVSKPTCAVNVLLWMIEFSFFFAIVRVLRIFLVQLIRQYGCLLKNCILSNEMKKKKTLLKHGL